MKSQSQQIRLGQKAQKPVMERIHCFSPAHAKDYKYRAALLLGYIANRIKYSKHEHDGKRWFYYTIEEFAEQFPYLKDSTIHEVLVTLEAKHKVLVRDKFNKRAADNTTWYAFALESDYQEALSMVKRIKFKVEHACRFEDVVSAVIVNHLAHWVQENQKLKPEYEWHRFSATKYQIRVPFSHDQITRSLKKLVGLHVLEQKPCGGTDRASFYRFKEPAFVDDAFPDIDDANPEMDDVFPDIDDAKPEIDDVFPDDVTCYKTTVERQQLEDIRFKDNKYKETSPAAPSCCVVVQTDGSQESTKSKPSTAALVTAAEGEGVEVAKREPPASGQRIGISVEEAMELLSGKRAIELVPFGIAAADCSGISCGTLSSSLQKWEQSLCEHQMESHFSSLDHSASRVLFRFVRQQEVEVLTDWLEIHSSDDLLKTIEPGVDAHVEAECSSTHGINSLRFLRCLCKRQLVDAYLAPGSMRGDWRGITNAINKSTEPILSARREAAERVRDEAIEREQQARVVKYRSRDVANEQDASISPAQKVAVFRNAIRSINDVGQLDGDVWRNDVIRSSNNSWTVAKKFFEANQEVSVEHLLNVLRGCMPSFEDGTNEGFDPLYCVKTARHITSLFKNLDRIIATLDMVDELPPLTYPEYEGETN